MHQTILPNTHIPLTEVSTPHFHYSTSVVLPWLLPSSLLRRLLPLLISSSDFLVLRFHNLESFSLIQ